MTSQEEKPTHELRLGEDIEQLGLHLTKMCVTEDLKVLRLYNRREKPFEVPYYVKHLEKTVDAAVQALINSHEFDDKRKDIEGKFGPLLSDRLIELKRKLREEAQRKHTSQQQEEKSAYEKAQEAKIAKWKEIVERLKNANIGISSETWRDGLVYRHNELRRVVDENIPESWQGLEFVLSSHRILNIHGCTLPFIGVVLARPSTYKTVTLSLIEPWYCTHYTDSFSPKSWITHSTAKDSEEELMKIDMLPKIKNRHFLTPELAPIFTSDEKDLGHILGTITRIADGHGLATDSGAWGHRAYGDTMFVWTGAAVDVPYKVHRLLGNLGFKIYFFRLPDWEKTEDELLKNLKEDFGEKKANIGSALYEYLAWFEIGPDLIHDEQSDLSKMRWNYAKDEEQALRWIIKIADVLKHLRCIAQTWTIEGDSQGSNYGYTHTQPESPERAARVLSNLARGHALLAGRNFITLEDIPIVVKTALSTAILDRVGLLYLLIENNGTLTTIQIAYALTVTRSTALRIMTELWVIGLVDMEDDVSSTDNCQQRYKKRITLRKQFQWLLGEDFQELLEGFKPVDYRAFIEKDKNEQTDGSTSTKQKSTNSRFANNNTFSIKQVTTFWRLFDKLKATERRRNPGMEVDKTTVPGENLRDELVSCGDFDQSNAATIIGHMVEAGIIEQPAWDTYRRRETT